MLTQICVCHIYRSYMELISSLCNAIQTSNAKSEVPATAPGPVPICFLASLPDFNDAKARLVFASLHIPRN